MPQTVDKIAQVIAKSIVAQNHTLELDEDGCGYFDDYDNKGYDCRPVAEAVLAALSEDQEGEDNG